MTTSVKRFVITHKWNGQYAGTRGLTFAKQGRNTYATRKEADDMLALFKKPGGLDRVLSPEQMETLRVDEVECYPVHFDPINTWVED